MDSRLGAYIAQQRSARNLTPQALAAAVGYRNTAKGGNRILALERDGRGSDNLLARVTAVLDLDPEHVQRLAAEDRRAVEDAWRQWVNEPVEPELRFRPIPAVWSTAALPVGLSRDAAIAYATAMARERGFTYVLVWSRREEIWCYPDGQTLTRQMRVGEVGGTDNTRARGS